MKKSLIKRSLILASLILGLSLLATRCGDKGDRQIPEPIVTDNSRVEIPPPVVPVPNHNVKPLDLGIAQSFAAMAYSSIISDPTSTISGKVGLKPGKRSLITLDAKTEVEGGTDNIYSGDDLGDKAIYLTLAREDLISAYREAAARPTDKDKIEAFQGKIGAKILPPGIYKWSSGLIVDSDVTLEGSKKDVWIFQITGDVVIASGVHFKLLGGARTGNIYWQVSGKVTLEENTKVPGTFMSQLTFEMKNSARLNGRALVKNGKLLMNQNTIEMPD